ncbi:Squalene/phytoene synthase [Rhodomicrobium vannielii ATCC 17100]|uniref:Squalene/phytoene synthase n=1 Tax=Rhodomicrobium vannielii (strain ATCC 17100 / DSM 162 / LMG 4299 / NCIMB 10020 / ATH 3.1.1) TaxID=648757 RepID=E3I013_RHOVT|nr:squalene/phytoene synthase family protein [Rhodomicrobium vannielii]ADP69964.1 Squalene/phytoene synthase [Rhodomicrobium vannielii ATCC 17100]
MSPAADTRADDLSAAELVRTRDRDRYWSALFAADAARPALLALYAFNAELNHVLAVAREPLAGQIRLKWWRDAIESGATGEKTGNPVADALKAAVAAHNLPRERLLAMVDARVPELFGDSPADNAEFAGLIEDSQGALFELAAAALGDRSDTTKDAAREAGLALGVIETLRALPFSVAHGRLPLPFALLEAKGVDFEAMALGEVSPKLRAALTELRADAALALQRFRVKQANIAPHARAAFLPLALVEPYLQAMAAPNFHPLRDSVTLNPLGRFWRIWRAARRNKL